jgi:hypothetical protein
MTTESNKIETELELDKNHKPGLTSGCKVTSIRLGHRHFAKKIRILGHPAVMENYHHYVLMTVPMKILIQEGFKSIFDMLQKLQKHYPKINLSSPVTVIEFRLEVVDEGSTHKWRPNANL